MIYFSIGDIVQREEVGSNDKRYLILRMVDETNEKICYECLEMWHVGAYNVTFLIVYKRESYRKERVIGHMDLTNLKLLK